MYKRQVEVVTTHGEVEIGDESYSDSDTVRNLWPRSAYHKGFEGVGDGMTEVEGHTDACVKGIFGNDLLFVLDAGKEHLVRNLPCIPAQALSVKWSTAEKTVL